MRLNVFIKLLVPEFITPRLRCDTFGLLKVCRHDSEQPEDLPGDSNGDSLPIFTGRGITYTRLIDDITCSTARDLTTEETTRLIEALHAMVRAQGATL